MRRRWRELGSVLGDVGEEAASREPVDPAGIAVRTPAFTL